MAAIVAFGPRLVSRVWCWELRRGTPVRLPGLGRLRASMTRTGAFRVHCVSISIWCALNGPGTFHGEILNRGRIGMDDAGYQQLWDEAHPDDPLVLPVRATRRVS